VRILVTLDTWGPAGGTERYASVVAPALLERGYQVDVLCRVETGPGPAGVPVHRVDALDGARLSPAGLAALMGALEQARPDVIYISALHSQQALELLLGAAPVVRYVHDHVLFCPGLNKVHETGETCSTPVGLGCLERYWFREGCICFKRGQHERPVMEPIRHLFAKRRELRLTARSRRILTNSRYMHGELIAAGLPPERTDVLPLFTDAGSKSLLEAADAALPAQTRAFLANAPGPVLLTPARLTLPDKGVDYLLTTLTKLAPEVRTVIAGTGPAEAWLRNKAVADGLGERVHFTGFLPSAAVDALYRRADVVCVPSVWDEPFGLVGLEAMAHAKPVVAFRVGGIPDWLEDGRTGFLVPSKDCDALAAAITRLTADAELAARMGAAGRERQRALFSREGHLDGLERHLRRAARTRS
jgi:glycosyltransferase involved in cell wall biosynthesis